MVLRSWGSLDPDTGKLIFGQKIERVTQRLARAREEADSGVFKPNREKDELTYALENPKHGVEQEAMGQFRGYTHSQQTRIPTEAARERRLRRQNESVYWSNLLMSHESNAIAINTGSHH